MAAADPFDLSNSTESDARCFIGITAQAVSRSHTEISPVSNAHCDDA